MAGAILFDEDPYIYYNDTWYNLGDSVEIKEGDGFWLFARIKCTYTLASLGVTVRLIVDTKEEGKEYTSISCNDAVTTIWVYCTATKEGTAKAELWMGDLNQLIETKRSWAISFPEVECAELTCQDATCITGASATLSAILSACFAPELKIGGKTITFTLEGKTYEGVTDGYSGLAEVTIPVADVPAVGTYTFTAEFVGDGEWGADTCSGTLTVTSAKKDTVIYPCSARYGTGIITFIATLKDEDGNKLFNKPIKFYVDNDYVCTGYTDSDGYVAKGCVHELSVGTYTAKAEFEGDGTYNSSSCTATLTVEIECSDYLTKTECETAGCYWWSDNKCHRVPEGEESWKTVSEPYWDGGYVKIDCVAHNLLTDKRYYVRGYCGEVLISSYELLDDGSTHVLPERLRSLKFTELAVTKWCSPLPFDVEVVLTEGWTEKDRVTRTIPEPTLTCTQTLNIKDQDTDEELVVDTVSVDSKTVTRIVTTYTVTIDKGGTYTVKATKAGYEDLEQSFAEDCLHILTFYMTPVPVKPYTINITVKDKNGIPIEGAYVDIDGCVLTCSEKKCTDSDVVVYEGECKTEEWKGDGYNVVTNSEGKASIGLPVTEATGRTVDKWRIRVGKSGYLNESLHDDWTEFKEANGEGTYNFEFTLTFITVEDKFVVHTRGFLEGDQIWVTEIGWRLLGYCMTKIGGWHGFFTPDAYPNGTIELTSADGLEEGKTYDISAPHAAGYSWCGDFKGTREIIVNRFGGFYDSVCELMGIDAASFECSRFWEEMVDPVYCANCITGVLKGVDIEGNEYHPGTFELAMFPVVVACSFLPMVPGATITKFLGRFLKKAEGILAVRKYFEDDYLDIYRIQVRGDDPRLTNWAKAIERGDIDGPDGARAWMRKILDDPVVLDADAVGYFDSMLDELTKQIDSIDPSHPKYAEMVTDLRARVIEAANACMDDVTDFTRVYDEKYTEFIDVARKGSKDTRVTTFVRSTDVVCSPTPFCKLSVLNAKDTLKVGRTSLDMLEYTKFIYKHAAHETSHEGFVDALRLLAVSDESDIIALRGYMKADDWVGFRSWTDNVLSKFDSNYVGQVDFFDNERVRILAQWAYEKVDDVIAGSGFTDEVTSLFDDLIKNTTEAKKVVDTKTVEMVGLGAMQEPGKAAEFFAKVHSVATPNTIYPDSLFGVLVPGTVAADLRYLYPLVRMRKWWPSLAQSTKDYSHVADYLKLNNALVVEAVAKGKLTKLDDFVAALSRGDTIEAHRLLNEAISGTPVGSVDQTYHVVRDTEKIADDLPSEMASIKIELRDFTEEVCEGTWTRTAKDLDDFKRLATGPEKASFRQIFARAGRRINKRISGGIARLRRSGAKDDVLERYSKTFDPDDELMSTTYSYKVKDARNVFWRNWKLIGGLVAGAALLVPWYSVDNAVFMIYLMRKLGLIEPGWGDAWENAYWDLKTADERLEIDPCVAAHQALYVDALERWYALLQVEPATPEQQESWWYYYKVAWATEPTRPREALKESCWLAFNSANERYFQIVQHCPSPVEPSFGFAVTEMPEMFPAISSTIEDADTLYVIPPDEDPSGDELYWEHGSPILVRLVGINAPEGPSYYYSCTNKKEPWLVRRLVTPFEECISEERWYVDSVFYAQANAWLAKQLPKDTHVTLRSDKDRQWLTKYKKIRFLAAVYKGTTNIDVEELKAGYAVLFIIEKNKQVWDTANNKIKTEYVNAETVAKLKKTRIWDPKWAKPCPATDVWYNYTTPARVGTETTFFGFVLGCDPSAITDWKWTGFPDDVVRTGREVKYTFSEEWSGKIYLEICAGALSSFRTVTVTKTYPNRKSPCSPFGDVDGDPDGYVNDTDAKLVSDYIDSDIGWDAVKDKVAEGIDEEEFKRRADVGNDGDVTQDDVNKIYEFYVGDRKSFPVCPAECPTPSVDFSVLPSSPEEGKEVLFTCKSSGGNGYSIVKRKWDFGDGDTDEDNHGVVTHVYSAAGKYDVWLTVTNDCDDGETGTKKKTITVSGLPQPKGNLTIKAFRAGDFSEAVSVASFIVDGIDKGGGVAVTVKDLLISENPHTIEIMMKAGEYMTCYADIPDECYRPCEFGVNVAKDVTTELRICMAQSILAISDPAGAMVNIKPEGAPTYVEIPSSYMLALGTYRIKFSGLAGYGTIEAVISVGEDNVICESVLTPGGNCYTSTPVTRPGLLVSGFLIKAYPKEAITKTVTFLSVPPDATVTIID